MASMDVTPQELRDVEIREAWRGYHRDDVDELLERAAATIESLEDQVRQAQLRAAQAPPPTPAPAPRPAPAPTPAPVERRPPGVDTDVIQRTLVLAQKAADEAVAEARAKAQQMLADSETKAQALVGEAEASARRIAETERRRLEEEIAQLTSARDTLNADVDALERFESEYKARLREAIHAELDALEQSSGTGGERPSLRPVHVPAPRSWSASPSWSDTSDSMPGAPSPALPSAGTPTVSINAVSAHEQWDEQSGEWETPTAAVVDDSLEHSLDPNNSDSLDDDAFFASLREAVRDDTPLSSREPTTEQYLEGGGDEPDDQRKLFRRRR
ncbi:MAG TPA: DivIVA domain-containing protein [Acidimicrobiia bacterium]|jgi:DivIVA domain-containing protein|nr:DivIVA domain-containing protein [Acidimicrobiia bacterium]